MPTQRDILIRVQGRGDPSANYPVEAELDDGSYFYGGSMRIVDRDLLKLALDVPGYGAALGGYLFSTPIQKAIEKAYATVADASECQLRLRLCFSPDARELHAYPWERLLLNWQGSPIALSASSLIPFSRFIQLEEGQQGPVEERPIRILFAVSNPKPESMPEGLQAIDVENELRGLVNAVAGLADVAISVLPGRTGISPALAAEFQKSNVQIIEGPTELNRLANLCGQQHVVHILCHGLYDSGTASLCLESETGDFAPALDKAIQSLLSGLASKPRLVYLSACESAKQDMDDLTAVELKPRQPHPMVGLAPKLVEAGIPAVLAMQDLIQVDVAHRIAAEFYARLFDHGEVDRALSEARLSAISFTSKEWAIPALFLRLKNGRLFATDPVRQILKAVVETYPAKPDSYYLPLEAIALTSKGLIADWERASEKGENSAALWRMIQPFRPGLTVLVGDAGSGKTTLLQRLASSSAPGTVPIVVDLRNYQTIRASAPNRAGRLIYETVHQLAPALTEEQFREMLSKPSLRFRFALDRCDEIQDSIRRAVLRDVNELVAQYPQHQFILALDCRGFQPWPEIGELVVIEPISIRKIKQFLENGPPGSPEARLLTAIRSAELFQFAAVPWLLLHMLEQVRQNVIPRSRISVLRDWLQTALMRADFDGEGRSYRMPESLFALAFRMQSSRRASLTLEETFEVLKEVRGQRDYSLEGLLRRLVNSNILQPSGDESVRFAYPPLQAYGAAAHLQADPNQGARIEEIVATLGQSSRVRWWRPTLALLAGLMVSPAPLLRSLVYGSSLMQGQQLFVAALCLLEYNRARGEEILELQSLMQQVYAALLWRSRRSNESDYLNRQHAVEFLGLLHREEAIPLLIGLAVDRVRTYETRPPDYEYSQVRFAAIRALRQMQVDFDLHPDLVAKYPDAPKLIESWSAGDIPALTRLLHGADVGVQGVAAFALGDLQDPKGAGELFAVFRDPTTDPATLWAITDALLSLEPCDVFEHLVVPMLAEAGVETIPPTAQRYERLIYLIGQLRTRYPAALAYIESYLQNPAPDRFKGRVLVALGKLHIRQEPEKQQWWRDIVQGKLDAIVPGPQSDTIYLRRKAIDALGELGDLQLLYSTQQDQDWVPELDEAFFRAAEACMAFSNAGG